MTVVRLPQNRTHLAVVAGTRSDGRLRQAVDRVLAASPEPAVGRVRRVSDRLHVVLIGPEDEVPDAVPGRVLWGTAVGDHGDAPDPEVLQSLDRPESERAPGGSWVALGIEEGRVRCVTSASPVQTLRHVRHGDRAVWATHAVTACMLADRAVCLHRDAVPEFVIMNYVLGDEDLVEGPRLVPDAAIIDVTASSAVTTSWWPLDARVQPQRATTPAGLRRLVGVTMARFCGVEGAALGLTAGIDSSLAASCLAEVGGSMPAFTLGEPKYPDVRAAEAICRAIGWHHAHLRTDQPPDWSADDLQRRASWYAADAPRTWLEGSAIVVDPQTVWVGGWGGEIARAFHWDGSTPPEDPLGALASPARFRALDPAAVDVMTERMAAVVHELAKLPRPRHDLLELFYARHNMRKWLGGHRPSAFAGSLAVYLEPDVLRGLLDVPPSERVDSRLMRNAHRLARPDLAEVAAAGIRPSAAGRLVERARHQLSRRGLAPVWGWPRLERALDVANRVGGLEVVRECMGPAWLSFMVDRAKQPAGLGPRRMLWNALTVAGLSLSE